MAEFVNVDSKSFWDQRGGQVMYESFFGFSEKPFNHTPNTKYLYLSDQHDGALRTLLYGIESRAGFILVTGEVGSGKTTTVRTLLNLLSGTVATSLIFNPLVNTLDLVRAINRDFGIELDGESLQIQLEALNQHLMNLDMNGKNAAVIIDEAQNLSFEALEMIRMLSNLETETHKLINIILVGQPELEAKLAKRELRQLAQRIQLHVKLQPLSLEQTQNYIIHRIRCAGEQMTARFDMTAIRKIYQKTRGIPRLINNLCDLSLMAAFGASTYVIDKKIIQKALKEVPEYVYHS